MRERIKQVELLELQLCAQKDKEAAADLERLERKQQRRIRREKELSDLKQKEKSLNQKIKASKTILPMKVPSASSKPAAAPVKEPATKQKELSDQVAEHEARRQRRAADKKAKKKAESSSLTIDSIRKIPVVQQQALDLMNKLQNIIPSLAADPNAGGNTAAQGLAAAAATGLPSQLQAAMRQPETRFVYVASLGQTVPVVDTPADIPSLKTVAQSSPETDSDDECSEDDDCQLLPEPGQRFLWRRNLDGSKFFVPVPVSPGLVWKYVLDNQTGRYERRQVAAAAANNSVKPQKAASLKDVKKSSSSHQYFDHRVQHHGALGMGARTGKLHREERQPSYVCSEKVRSQPYLNLYTMLGSVQ